MIKAKLNRVAVRVKDARQAAKDFEDLFGMSFYGPYDDDHMGLCVALPKTGGIELMSPLHDHDAIGAYAALQEKGEGVSGIALRVDDFESAKAFFKSKGLEPMVEFNHGEFREMIFPPQPATHGLELAINEFPDANGAAIQCALDMGIDWNEVCDWKGSD